MTTGRQTRSRAKEFDLVFGFLDSPEKLAYQISRSPKGGTLKLEGIDFEYGNVKRLAEHLDASAPTMPFGFKAKYVCHLDGLQASRKRAIEQEFGLDTGSISSQDSKADLLVIDRSGKHYFLSVKDPEKPSKLGQKSGSVSYGKANLHGGLLGTTLDELNIPSSLSFRDTNLTQDQFGKLSRANQIFAFFKKQHPSEWENIVAASESRALDEIRKFCTVLKDDKDSLISFISETLGGNLKIDPDFYIVFGDRFVNLALVLQKLKDNKLFVTLEEYNPRGKCSIIVRITVSNKTYCLTKIEPSFEGKKTSVSQVKGIIYHFQQYEDVDNSWKKLIFDVVK
jgi:hypothetical protein